MRKIDLSAWCTLFFACCTLVVLEGCGPKKVPHTDAILFDFKGNVKLVHSIEKYYPVTASEQPWEMEHFLYFNRKGNIDSIITHGQFPSYKFTSRKLFSSTGDNEVSWQEFDSTDKLNRFGRREWISDRQYVDLQNETNKSNNQKDTGYLDEQGKLSKLNSTVYDSEGVFYQTSSIFLRDEPDGVLRIIHANLTEKKTDTLAIKPQKTDRNGNFILSEETGRSIKIIRERNIEYY